MKTTKESNKLIAQFMGYDIINADIILYAINGIAYPINKLEYHQSWDWLMPVVEKIDTLFGEDDTVDDMINRVRKEVLLFSPLNKGIVYNILFTYQAVVEFINDYNNHKK